MLHVLTPSFPTRRASELTLRKLWPILFCDASWAVYYGRLVLRIVRRRHTHAGLAEICRAAVPVFPVAAADRTDSGHRTRSQRCAALAAFRSEEHTSELQSLMRISYAVFCLKKKIVQHTNTLPQSMTE